MQKSLSRYALFLLSSICLLAAVACGTETSSTAPNGLKYQKTEGETMGTTYHITYADSVEIELKTRIDSLLVSLNNEVSTYIATSFISKFNHSKSGIPLIGENKKPIAPHFFANLQKSKEIFEKSGGAFDPTVMPLVNYWGFGYTEHLAITSVDTILVDSLRKNYTGFEKVVMTKRDNITYLEKANAGVELDFSALAKGYGVDAVALFLEKNGITNYMVEIGGEVRGRGKNERGTGWVIGINTPSETAHVTDFQSKIRLVDRSLATSGNYRNYYEVNGQKYSHTINPKTGFPERSNLLSATILAPDCMTADALATTCMVLGLEKAMELVLTMSGIDGYFIFGDTLNNFGMEYTSGIDSLLVKE